MYTFDAMMIWVTSFGVSYIISRNKVGVAWGVTAYVMGIVSAVLVVVLFLAIVHTFEDHVSAYIDDGIEYFLFLLGRGVLTSFGIAGIGVWAGTAARRKKVTPSTSQRGKEDIHPASAPLPPPAPGTAPLAKKQSHVSSAYIEQKAINCARNAIAKTKAPQSAELIRNGKCDDTPEVQNAYLGALEALNSETALQQHSTAAGPPRPSAPSPSPKEGEPYARLIDPKPVKEGMHRGRQIKRLADGSFAVETYTGWRRFYSMKAIDAYLD